MRKATILALTMALLVAMMSSAALAKGKPAGKGKPAQKKVQSVAYVFEGEVLSVDADSVLVAVEKGNKFAKPFFGTQLDVAVNAKTKVVEDDVKTTLSDLDAGDAVVVKSKAPRNSQSFTANIVVATSPTALYYFDADGDGFGAGEPQEFIVDEQPEGWVSDGTDNCADVSNPDQLDTNGDGVGDACEPTTTV
jgi:hypothetical protein